ncbi:hypothetical protein GIS00_06680 [Nakamurella sp. YIM 132087]|uniref:Uncharacterized protein n=1 Tax=Nakamurella alba TaxID=2665158 RepID=A0A7K1FHP9_9ACTN|nr:hypothetical protein [Nakamurella alba]MTD13628.1 hypothetical protein [Nakamurella alba]
MGGTDSPEEHADGWNPADQVWMTRQDELGRIAALIQAGVAAEDPKFALVEVRARSDELVIYRSDPTPEDAADRYRAAVLSEQVALRFERAVLSKAEVDILDEQLTRAFPSLLARGIRLTAWGVHDLGGRYVVSFHPEGGPLDGDVLTSTAQDDGSPWSPLFLDGDKVQFVGEDSIRY